MMKLRFHRLDGKSVEGEYENEKKYRGECVDTCLLISG